jgi:hypothetical protein
MKVERDRAVTELDFQRSGKGMFQRLLIYRQGKIVDEFEFQESGKFGGKGILLYTSRNLRENKVLGEGAGGCLREGSPSNSTGIKILEDFNGYPTWSNMTD